MRASRAAVAVTLLILAAMAYACDYKADPQDGAQRCASSGSKLCPDNYYCSNQYCYRHSTDVSPSGTGGSSGLKGNGSSCSSSSECQGFCCNSVCQSSSSCSGLKSNGSLCSSDSECVGYCCNSICQTSSSCGGLKSNGSSCSSDSECVGYCCSSVCQSSSSCGGLKSNGSSCSLSSECVGYCCNSICQTSTCSTSSGGVPSTLGGVCNDMGASACQPYVRCGYYSTLSQCTQTWVSGCCGASATYDCTASTASTSATTYQQCKTGLANMSCSDITSGTLPSACSSM